MEELAKLVRAAQGGDLAAYGEVVRRFQDMAYGCAYAVLGDFHRAEDAAQEAFIDAYRRLADLREPKAFPGWFRKIVLKHCDRLTRRKRPPTVPLDDAVGVESPREQPDSEVARMELADAVLGAIRTLPEGQRMATTLFYINGYSHQEVADFLDVPVSTVKKRLHDSRRKLKERMVPMVADALKNNVPDERFSQRVIDELLGRPKLLDIPGHPIRLLVDQVRSLLKGYEYVEGDEIVGKDVFPGSGGYSPYHVDERRMLRGETTHATFAAMRGRTPPIRLLTAGRVFRQVPEETATHLRAFHQLDVLHVAEGVTVNTMKRELGEVIGLLMGTRSIRWENAQFNRLKDCFLASAERDGQWLSIAGCGMLDVRTLREAGLDPRAATGYAYGMGLERIVSIREGIDDVRKLWQPPYVPGK